MTGNFYSILTILIVLTALFSYVNIRFIRLPATIGIMLISLISSIGIILLGRFNPAFLKMAESVIDTISFEKLLLEVMLSFLLFAGAIHIDLGRFRKEIIPIATYATLGILISTALIGILMFAVFKLFDLNVPIIYCLLFAALISPTDPIAVLGILKEANIPASIQTRITGESLFNDGVAVVVFISLLNIAVIGSDNISAMSIGGFFFREAGGGIAWGCILGYGGFLLLRSIDHYQVEVLITIAMVMGGYLLANYWHISGPLAMVVAGIITGNKGKEFAMSDITKDYVNKFWELIDEILNALLFLVIGLEMIVLMFEKKTIWIGIITIAVVLVGRYISVLLPTLLMSFRRSFEKSMIPLLTWGGLRGGISVALALSLPKGEYRDILVSITYIVVIFSISVQGLTIGKLAKRLRGKKQLA